MPDWLVVLLVIAALLAPFILHFSGRWFVPRNDGDDLPS
jgi:hypothetical protein